MCENLHSSGENIQATTSSANSPSARRKRARVDPPRAAHARPEAHVDLTLDDDEPVVRPPASRRPGTMVTFGGAPAPKDDKRHKPEAQVEKQAEPPVVSGGLGECTICLMKMTKPGTTKCGHLFCHECILDWIKTKKT
jgi:hypothetical protein